MCPENGSYQARAPARVLVVDDEVLICEGVGKILRRLGHVADVSYGSDDALARLEAIDYDVMILDLHMPGASAQETLRRARHLRSRLKIIVLSGQSSREQLNATVGNEVDDCLAKPATATEIESSINMVLHGR